MTNDREKELCSVPPKPADKANWPKGVRTIGQDELDKLGVDRWGRIYWDGKTVEIREFRLRWPERIIAFIGVFFAVIAVIIQTWQWGCQLEWLSTNICPPI